MLQSSFSTTQNAANQNQRQQELLQNLSAPSPASVTNYRNFSEDSTSVISHDDTTLDEGSDSSRMSATSVSTIKDDTLVSSITIAPSFSTATPETANDLKAHIPLSFLGITKQHKNFVESQKTLHSSMNGTQVSSTSQEPKHCNEETTNMKDNSCLMEAMESHSALISTPTNELTGNVYSFSSNQFGAGGMCDINTASKTNIGTSSLICQQPQQRVLPSDILQQQQQQIIQHNKKQIEMQNQENQQMCTSFSHDTAKIKNPIPSNSASSTLPNAAELDASTPSLAVENNNLNCHQTSQMQDQLQHQPIAPEKCKYSIANAESEVASISIKLPPSILSNQDRLESIVNTINKAITTSSATQQKDSQKAAEMIASININNTPQQQQQQQFNQGVTIHPQQTTQPQAFIQGPIALQQDNIKTGIAETVPAGNNIPKYGQQSLQLDQNTTSPQDWNFEQDGAEAKKIKVSPTEKELCDAAAVNATNALHSVASSNTCPANSISQQALPDQCFSEVEVQAPPGANGTWTNTPQSGQTFAAPIHNTAHGTTFTSSTVWDGEEKDSKTMQIIECVSGQPQPTFPTAKSSWPNAVNISQGNKNASDAATNSVGSAMDAAAAAANVTNAINAAAASLNAVAASSILEAQAATNALNAAAAAASATKSLNAATALAVAVVNGNVEPSIQNWSQSGATAVISNTVQTSQHSYTPIEPRPTFTQSSNLWNTQSEQAHSPESREQGTIWNGATAQLRQGSFDSGSAVGEFPSTNSPPGQTWNTNGCNSNNQAAEHIKQASSIPTSGVWQNCENVSPAFVATATPSNNYSISSPSWNNKNQEQKVVEHVTEVSQNNSSNKNSPSNLNTWQAVSSPESFQQVQNTQGTFSPIANWNENIKENHNSPTVPTVHANTNFSEVENQQHFNQTPQIWKNQHGNAKEDKGPTNINRDSQMWDLTQQNASLHGQRISKPKNLQINTVSEVQQGQQLQSTISEVVSNSSPIRQPWETSSSSTNVKPCKQEIMVGEEWSSPINNDPMLSETSAGVIQQQQAEEKWPSFNTNPKQESQWNTAADNNHVSQQPQKTDWTTTFNQQSNSEGQTNSNASWSQFSVSGKVESPSLQQSSEQTEQHKQPTENWPTFSDQGNHKWPNQPQELPNPINKLPLSNVEEGKASDWPSFDDTCKNAEKWPLTNDNITQDQNGTSWSNFKIQSGNDTTEWKVVSNQSHANNGVAQDQPESTPQNSVWSPSSQQQQQVSQDQWSENKDAEKWLQGASVGQQASVVSEAWVSTLNVDNKQNQQNTVSVTNTSWPDNLTSNENKAPQQTWGISAQQQVQSLQIAVPGIGSGEVRSVLDSEAHRSNISSSRMLVVDPKDTALPVTPTSSLKESTPMDVDTGSYDNPLLTPNPQIQ